MKSVQSLGDQAEPANSSGASRGPRVDLPTYLTSFIGREPELEDVKRLLAANRLLTITGPGGIGKTRLAVHAAAGVATHVPDRVCFVSLAPLRDAGLVLTTIAQTLGVIGADARPVQERLVDYLRDKRVLLVLDNFEQVVAAAPRIVDLLSSCPRLHVLVTSRERLNVSGEHDFPVPPLSLPEMPNSQQMPFGRPTEQAMGESVRLFIDRAQSARPDLALNEENARAVAEICRRLDGIPLSIELAAARVTVLPPRALLARLEGHGRASLLTAAPRDFPDRQQSLRATLDWSHSLMEPHEKALFRRMGVFLGGCTLEGIEGVCGERESEGAGGGETETQEERQPDTPVLDLLTSLIDKSLLGLVEVPSGRNRHEAFSLSRPPVTRHPSPRYAMLETIREYAVGRLLKSGEAEALRRRHAVHYLTFAEEAELLMHGFDQAATLDRLDRDLDNVRAALRWTVDHGETGLALCLVHALYWLWAQRYPAEGRAWHSEILAMPNVAAHAVAWGRALATAGGMAWLQSDYDTAQALLTKAFAMARDANDPLAIAQSLEVSGMVVQTLGDRDGARSLFEESSAISRQQQDTWHKWNMALCLYWIAMGSDEKATVTALLAGSLARFREIGDLWGIILVSLQQAGPRATSETRSIYEDALAASREIGDPGTEAAALRGLGEIALRGGDLRTARERFAESLALYQDRGEKRYIYKLLAWLGVLAVLNDDPERGIRLISCVAMGRSALGGETRDGHVSWPEELDGVVGRARQALGEPATSIAWAQGQELTLAQAIPEALCERDAD